MVISFERRKLGETLKHISKLSSQGAKFLCDDWEQDHTQDCQSISKFLNNA
jgi:hypothetical protein